MEEESLMSFEALHVMQQREERANAPWKHRRALPLTILAWTGAFTLMLWAAGQISRSLLLRLRQL
jgi:hypothetical protein